MDQGFSKWTNFWSDLKQKAFPVQKWSKTFLNSTAFWDILSIVFCFSILLLFSLKFEFNPDWNAEIKNSVVKSKSYDCNFSWKWAEDENRWRRYNRSGKFINEAVLSDWQNITQKRKKYPPQPPPPKNIYTIYFILLGIVHIGHFK